MMSFSLALHGTRQTRSGMGCRFMMRAPRPAFRTALGAAGMVRLDTVEADDSLLAKEELLPELLVTTLRGTVLELPKLVGGVLLG
jgi:hypothetical protein